jgi:hypothetical protein
MEIEDLEAYIRFFKPLRRCGQSFRRAIQSRSTEDEPNPLQTQVSDLSA